MSDNKSTMRKTIGWAYGAVAIFTAISIVVPILMDKLAKGSRKE